ncbi:dihydrodipicolinate synthase family protein [Marinilabilia rubra]|uniref:Dihydrodipicolinate synthetase n=1 Tax=Marinilabilia rubra TaxID=2162893 RepID=A0A2U2BBE5_9BACT|nr:dihydrodipicolinate synthase family protein [Marinilabilia rubra]PWE00381.1 dihydrodipicolinate synthetase [Marinilabilia rubra]
MNPKKFEGLVAAPFTPMHPDGELNLELIEDYYTLLKNNQISGAFINGSTGEGVSTTMAEKKAVTKAWAEQAAKSPGVRIINLVGGTCLKDCIELAQFSQEQKVDAIAVLAPFYFKPPSVIQLAEFIAGIAKEVPEMPVYFYHIPVLTGVNFPMKELLTEMDEKVPNFAGIKYTHVDFMDFLSCLNHRNGHYDLLWGRDENFLAALSLGAKGGVGSTYNYAAPLYHALIGKFQEGNLQKAGELQQKAIHMIELLGKYGGIATGKAYMKYIGLNCGEFRPPVANMSDADFRKFTLEVKSLQMEELFSKSSPLATSK